MFAFHVEQAIIHKFFAKITCGYFKILILTILYLYNVPYKVFRGDRIRFCLAAQFIFRWEGTGCLCTKGVHDRFARYRFGVQKYPNAPLAA